MPPFAWAQSLGAEPLVVPLVLVLVLVWPLLDALGDDPPLPPVAPEVLPLDVSAPVPRPMPLVELPCAQALATMARIAPEATKVERDGEDEVKPRIGRP
jgi:hypothetical protein